MQSLDSMFPNRKLVLFSLCVFHRGNVLHFEYAAKMHLGQMQYGYSLPDVACVSRFT